MHTQIVPKSCEAVARITMILSLLVLNPGTLLDRNSSELRVDWTLGSVNSFGTCGTKN